MMKCYIKIMVLLFHFYNWTGIYQKVIDKSEILRCSRTVRTRRIQ